MGSHLDRDYPGDDAYQLKEALDYLLQAFPSAGEQIREAAAFWTDRRSSDTTAPPRLMVFVRLFDEYADWLHARAAEGAVHERGAGYRTGSADDPRFVRFLNERASYKGYQVFAPRELDKRIYQVVGESQFWDDIRPLLERTINNRVPTLILGETGTGKDQVARIIHDCDPAVDGSFLHIHCSYLTRERFRDELKELAGAAADGKAVTLDNLFEPFGTVCFSQVDRLPLPAQGMLETYLRERRSPARANSSSRAPRMLFTTASDLEHATRRGDFLHTLFLEIGVLQIVLPSLNQHRSEISTLARHVLHTVAELNSQPAPMLPIDALRKLEQHLWPGNLAELRNVMERAAITAGNNIRPVDIQFDVIFWHAYGQQDERLERAVSELEETGFKTSSVLIEQVAMFLLQKGEERFRAAELNAVLANAPSTSRSYLQKLRQHGFITKHGEKKAATYRVNLNRLLGEDDGGDDGLK